MWVGQRGKIALRPMLTCKSEGPWRPEQASRPGLRG
jgi:hypothetical protein